MIVKFYTSMPNYQVLMALLAYIKRLSDAVTYTHIAPGPGRPKSLKIEDEFLAVLMRLRLGLLVQDVSERFAPLSHGTLNPDCPIHMRR